MTLSNATRRNGGSSIVNEDLVLYAVYSVSDNNCVEAELSSFNQSDEVVIAISKDGKYYAEQRYNGIYEIKFNDNLECIYFKSWEMLR